MYAAVVLLSLLTAAQWRADLDFLAREMPRRHKNLFHHVSQQDFDSAVQKLRARIPEMDDLQVVAGIQQIGAMIGDAHTGITATRPEMRFSSLPLRLYVYADGVFVQAAPPELRAIVGARVLRIGATPIDEVFRRARTITDHSNESTVRAFIPYKLVRPEILRFLGIIETREKVQVTFETGGHELTRELPSMGRDQSGAPAMGGISMAMGAAPGSGWVDARDASKHPLPLYLQHQQEPYWFQYLRDQRALYIQCNQVTNRAGGETIEQFFTRAYAEADSRHADRIILDLRLNGGGDNTLILPIVHGIIKRDAINRKGHFFVIIGRLTQSAAQNLTNMLERQTNAIFAGEPTGESPNHYGEPDGFELPNSHLHVNVSTLWWQDLDPRDRRDATTPQLESPLTAADYAANRDPAMNAIKEYTRQPLKSSKKRRRSHSL